MLFPVQDVMEQYSLWKLMIHNNVKIHKELPLWNPWYFSGHPFVSNLLSSMFYPINIVYIIFNPDFAFNYVFMFDIFLAGLFTYFFCRQIGLEEDSSVLSSITFMFSGYFIDHIFAGHLANIDAIIWMPASFWMTEVLIKEKKIRYIIFLSFFLTMQVLAGHIQHAFYSNIALFIYFIYRNLQIYKSNKNLEEIKNNFLNFFSSIIIFILLSSIQLLPSFEFLFYSVRSRGLPFDEASLFSFPPYQIIGLVLPEFFGSPIDQSYWGGRNFFELTAYVSVTGFLLAIFSIIFNKNKYTKIFLFLSVFSILFAFGRYSPLYHFLYKYVPGFNLFRIPSTTLFIYIFSISILSGFGFSFLFYKKNKESKLYLKRVKKILILVFLLSVTSIIILSFFKEKMFELGEKIIIKKYEIHSKNNVLKEKEYYFSKISLSYKHIIESLIVFSFFLFLFLSSLDL
ncbi:MAG: hypothetical protein QXY45_00795, partial [Candidatus Aenigmatarchaeota archaeon]